MTTALPFELSSLTPNDWELQPCAPASLAQDALYHHTRQEERLGEPLCVVTLSLDIALTWVRAPSAAAHLTQGEYDALGAAIMEGLCRVAMQQHRGIRWDMGAALEGLRAHTNMLAMDTHTHHQHIIEEVSAALPSWLDANPALRHELMRRVA